MGADLQQLSPVGPELRPEWSSRLVMDVALNASAESICEAHDLVHHDLERIFANPLFVRQVEALKKDLEKDGATFKLKAQLQADFYLSNIHTLITDPDMDPRVRLRAIEDMVRWAGFDAPAPVGGPGSSGGFSININFGTHERKGITIDGNQS